jgi:hypothetical protein
MKMKTLYAFGLLTAAVLLTGCKNGDNEFPDYEGGVSVYFANQTPVRTLVMGEDKYDTTLDNAHKCQIQATQGGSYGSRAVTLSIVVDNTLCNNLYFDQSYTQPVLPMPSDYYTLSSNTMTYTGFRGAVEVQLTDKFFQDPKALEVNYVIPVVITGQVGADRILSGTPWDEFAAAPIRTNPVHWKVAPQDYTLYCVKYICKYDAKYLRYGEDRITKGGTTTTVTRAKTAEPKDMEVKSDIKTLALNKIIYPVTIDVDANPDVADMRTCELEITFGNDDQVVSIASRTAGVTATGSGSYKYKSEKKAWGDKDRDGLYLDYTIDFGGGVSVTTKDILIWQQRGIVKEEFTTYYKN